MAKRKPSRATKPSSSSAPKTVPMESLKRFIRTRGADFLRDPNISSVGVGYKVVKGKPTNDISIQFTVNQKASGIEALAAVGTEKIPATIEVDGVPVPTDVIERVYEPSFRLLAAAAGNRRKQRLDPIAPGISAAYTTGPEATAGTIGCIVFDQRDGTPYALSNWHVFNGPLGNPGDEIAQPGPFDDNRVQLNRMGTLVRSHLGHAGDCAVATIEDRDFVDEIVDLGVRVKQLAEPELGDRVIKSGRTTGVTRGLVRRVHTIARINYGPGVGQKEIGGFEIGVDPDNPPVGGEISMPGDSGAAWLIVGSDGAATGVMAGLHFAGEVTTDPDEHALACYAGSVFEKLEIALSPPPESVVEAVARLGYDAAFLGTRVELPRLGQPIRDDTFHRDGSEVIPYTHFSLAMSISRRFARWVAWNIDGGRIRKISRDGIPFLLDPDVDADVQVGNALYANNRLDRGHIARRADLCWGSLPEARRANRDSFFFTNITPQMDDFNQSSQGGLWGRLEDAIFEDVDVDDLHVSVFGGPVFHADDREFRQVRIPREFWKAIAYVEDGILQCRAFLLTQDLNELEALDLDEFRVFQVAVTEVEQRTGLSFPDVLKAADGFAESLRAAPEGLVVRRPLESTAEIVW